MKKVLLLFAMFFVCLTTSYSQKTASGTILDNEGLPVIGANVLVKGTAVGTITDIDGSFSLTDIPEDATTLVVSYTGYAAQELDLSSTSVFDIVLQEGEVLNEVVVTGLGIKKEKKALGYGVSKIGADGIADRGETDVARILNGKATGVNIQQTSGLAGSGTNIIIRGYSSITGSNQPLFVVDGVPFNAATNTDGANSSGSSSFTQGSATASSRFLDLDPNNIAEINILKGLSATVLYGEAGRNGVILVTTKTGEGGVNESDDLGISVSQGFSISQIANLPSYQNTYGNGFSGNYGAFFSNWGPAFDVRGTNGVDADGTIPHPYDNSRNNSRLPEFIDQRYDYRPYETVENFFGNGSGYNSTIQMDKSFGKSSVSAAYSYVKDGGFTPNRGKVVQNTPGDISSYNYVADGDETNNYEKHNISIGARADLGKGVSVKGSFNYLTSNRVNPPAASAGFLSTVPGGNASLFSDVLYTPRSIDLLHLPYEAADGSMVYYRGGSPIQNPLWTLNNTRQLEDIERFFGRIEVGFEITDWLTAQVRGGVDQYTQSNQSEVNKGGSQIPDGRYATSTRINKIYDHVANLLYNFNLNEDFSLDGLVGFNFRGETNDYDYLLSTEQFVFNLFTHQNFATQQTYSLVSDEKTNGLYANATLGYRNFFYLGLAARNDWTSTLPEANRSVFYPSASISFIPSELGNFGGNAVNYLKFRVGYGSSAGYPDPYTTSTILDSNPRAFVGADGSVVQTNSVSNVLGNPNLRAEKIEEIEFGVEGNFLNNIIGLDFSYYIKNSNDLLISLPLDPSTGYTSTTTNGASVSNKGIELGLTLTPFKKDFGLVSQINFTKNTNVVESIIEGVDLIIIDGFNGLGNYAVPNEPYGAIYGTAFVKDENGQNVVNSLGEYDETNEPVNIGDPNPNYTLDWINTISFKNVALNVQLAYQDGGDIYSATALTLLGRGNTIDTDFDRFLPIVLPGVLSDGSANDIQTYAGDAFFSGYGAADEGAVFDATNIRLREVSLSFNLPDSMIDKLGLKDMSLKLFGNNLWYKAVNFPEGLNFDPEVLSLGVGNGRGFDYLTGPTSKRYGVALNVKF